MQYVQLINAQIGYKYHKIMIKDFVATTQLIKMAGLLDLLIVRHYNNDTNKS